MKPLDQNDLEKIYQTIIKPGFFSKIKNSTNKTCVFLGGQPGSGKSYLNDISINALENKSAVVIDSDLIRRHHPHIPLIAEKDIYSLDQDCYRWGEMLIKDSIKENKNVVFDGTFGGNIDHTYSLLERFKSNGYTTKLNLLATNDVVSKIGFNWRYEFHKSLTGTGRMVDLSYHNKIYERIPENLEKILPENLIDEFNIYGRNHLNRKTYLCQSYDGTELRSNPDKAIEQYKLERTREFSKPEIIELKGWYAKTYSLVENNNGNLQAFGESIVTYDTKASLKLKEQIESITKIDHKRSLINLGASDRTDELKQQILKGNLGQDPIFQKSKQGHNVAAFSIGYNNEKKETVWQGVQVWKDVIEKEKIKELKKGDFVELKGYYGKEYANKKGETQKDFILENCKVLKRSQDQQIKPNRGLKI